MARIRKNKKLNRIGITGVGKDLPDYVLTNAELEKLVDTNDEWITTRTGIKTRRINKIHQEAASDYGARAAKKALKDAGLAAKHVDLIIVATITPDMQFPSTACLIQAKICAIKAVCFDVSAACAGYLYAISIANSFLSSGMYRNALVIGTEILSSITDWEDRSTCVLFGDGAGAAVLEPVKKGGILSALLGSDGTAADILKVPAGGSLLPATHQTLKGRLHFIKMHGADVFKHAVRTMSHSVQQILDECGLKLEDITCLIPHQANIRIIDALIQRLGLDKAKVFINVDKYGNMSSASSAVALCEAAQKGRIKKGEILVQVAFGAGLTWGATVVEWTRRNSI